ncbi:MAG: hypothetical protein JEY97_11000 [Bacteroidales bacterium]|nr:hypothetical protein [Bacteroidales bacterium]
MEMTLNRNSKVKKVDCYELSYLADAVNLNIEIGQGLNAATLVKLNDGSLKKEKTDSFSTQIGTNSNLIGKTLILMTTLCNVQQRSFEAKMKITISGGRKNWVHEMKKVSQQEGKYVFYSAEIDFI